MIWLVVAGALLAQSSTAPTPDAVTMRVTAGLGGVVKAERWMPVRVTITTPHPLDGQLRVAWSDVRLTRAVAFGSAGTRTLELYVRSSEPAATLSVTLQNNGTTRIRADVPVQVHPQTEPVAVCVRTPEFLNAPAAPRCGTWIEPADLPVSPRGYEVADTVLAMAVIEPRLSRDQRAALREWSTLRRLDETGDLGLTPQPARPALPAGLPAGIRSAAVAGLFAYATCLLVAGWWARSRARRAWQVFALVAVLIAAGGGGVAALGHSGLAGVHVRHQSVLQQIPQSGRSLITTRGLAAFGGRGDYRIQTHTPDGNLEAIGPSGRAEQAIDESGDPVLQGSFALGTRQAFVIEAVADVQPLAVREEPHQVTLVNRSAWPLRDCRFGDGFNSDSAFALAPGESRAATKLGDGIGPLATCSLDDTTPFTIRSDGQAVRTTGSTLIAVYRSDGQAPTAAPASTTEDVVR